MVLRARIRLAAVVAVLLGCALPAAGQRGETVVCTRVEIALPHAVVLYSARGAIRARVVTDVGPGEYEVRYVPATRQLEVSPWGSEARVIHITLNGSEALGRRYRACIESMVEPVPLVVRGPADEKALLALVPDDGSAGPWTEALEGLGANARATLSADEVASALQSGRAGVVGAPSLTTREVLVDAQRKEQWDALEPWEKKLWNEFIETHRDAVDITRSPDELHADAGVRFSMALLMSLRHMPEGVRDAARELLTDSTFLTTTMVAITAYLALWMAPEPIFTKATAIVSTVGLVAVAGFTAAEIMHVASALDRLWRDTRKARTTRELERAAERFGKSFGASSLRVFLALALMHGSKHVPTPPPTPAAGVSGGSLALAGAHGGTITTAIPRSGAQIQVLADGTVHIIQGGMTAAAMSEVSGGGGKASENRAAPGEWQPVSENMSPRAKAYQEQVTGRKAGESYVVHGVRFDGYKNGKLIEAKGQGYEDFMSVEGGFLEWFKRGEAALMKQARRQFLAASAAGVRVEWHVAEKRFAEFLTTRFERRRWNTHLKVLHTPKSPR